MPRVAKQWMPVAGDVVAVNARGCLQGCNCRPFFQDSTSAQRHYNTPSRSKSCALGSERNQVARDDIEQNNMFVLDWDEQVGQLVAGCV